MDKNGIAITNDGLTEALLKLQNQSLSGYTSNGEEDNGHWFYFTVSCVLTKLFLASDQLRTALMVKPFGGTIRVDKFIWHLRVGKILVTIHPEPAFGCASCFIMATLTA